MNKLFLFFIAVSGSYFAFAQTCGTPHSPNPTIYSSTDNARGLVPHSV